MIKRSASVQNGATSAIQKNTFPDEYAALEAEYMESFLENSRPLGTAAETAADAPAQAVEADIAAAKAPAQAVEADTAADKAPAEEAVTVADDTAREAEAARVTEVEEASGPVQAAEEQEDSAPSEETEKAQTPFADLLDEPDEDGDEKPKKKKKVKPAKKSSRRDKFSSASGGSEKKKKGRFITPLILLGILLIIILACVYDVFYCMSNFEINFYQVESMHVSADVRIAVISDVHLSVYGEDNKELVSAVKSLHPDIIISAGDLVTYGEDNYDSMLSLCSQLAEIAPFYGIMGNHEDEKVYLEYDEKMRDRFAETGMILLINRCETIRINNNVIELVGVSGGPEGFDLYGGKDAMEKLDDSSTALRICIAHVPTLFTDRLDRYDFDLGIAGHTHGGIIRLPVVGGLYSAEEGFLPDFDGGLTHLHNGAELFVSRGLGNSGKIPRFNNTPELAVLDIRWY